jgi:membrane protease YdiL (CAAX protease family)
MSDLTSILRRSWGLILFALLYLTSLALLIAAGFDRNDALMELAIFGLAFPALAWWTTRGAARLPTAERCSAKDLVVLAAMVLALSFYLIAGPQWIDSFAPKESPRLHEMISLMRKLLVFVALPYAIYRILSAYFWRDYGVSRAALRELGRSHLPVVLVMSAVMLLFNYFIGQGATPLRAGRFSAEQLAIGLPLCFGWLLVEAGLVEEFFFRAVLQARLSAWFKSETTGVALMALVFGLAHAPGFIFRNSGEMEGLGAHPSALLAIAYTIVVLAPAGIVFGVVWARTRNLYAAIVIHAATDLLPNAGQFIETWRI